MTNRKKSARAGKPAHVMLAPVLDAAHGADLHEALGAWIDEPETVTLDAGEVEKIDTAGLQVLLAFVLARRAQGRAVVWEDVGNELQRAAELLGLTGLLELPT